MYELFKVVYIDCNSEEECEWSWDTLEELKNDYGNADILALPNDFDKIVKTYINCREIKVATFGEYIQYIKDNIGW